MTTQFMPSTQWHTRSNADSANATLTDAHALGAHLHVCTRYAGSLFAVKRGAECMHGFFASRFVTTLALIALFIGLGSLAI